MTLASLMTTSLYAQDIETLVMPGEVIQGHADIEAECSSCHKMFDKPAQRQLCLDCHEDVAGDVTANTGYHGQHIEVKGVQCATCHTDHEGRDARIVVLDEASFDHAFTDFELTGKHLEAECSSCHAVDEKHRDAPQQCVACHQDDDAHESAMGSECGSCHTATEWQDARFDHDETGFGLIGRHAETECLGCHTDHTFPTPDGTTCYACHAGDDAHDGRSGQQCESCHNPTDWHDSRFDHARDTDFPLLGRHSQAACGDCHSDKPFEDEMDTACASCHVEDDAHDGHRSLECAACHDSRDWAAPTFDHGRDTDYRIHGAHLEVACHDCHVDPIFESALDDSCRSCHLDDDPHDDTSSMECHSCHTEIDWQHAALFDHDLTRFPLLGAHFDNECADCHTSHAFATADDDCVSCHRDDDPHRGNFPRRCDECHNPVSWAAWTFDHNIQTDFEISGAHVDVACADCHRSDLDRMRSFDGTCGLCHRSDDVHDGEFGPDCGRCHSAESFTEVRSLQ